MPRHFNTAGPCRPEYDYMLPATARLPEVMELVEDQRYFVLHAPRQSGKSTTLYDLARQLVAAGRYAAIVVSAEVGAAFPDDPGAAEAAILQRWRTAARFLLPADLQPPPWPDVTAGSRVGDALSAWAAACPRALVVFIDEIDALQDNVLISVLRQIRDGYPLRPTGFPWSLALVGLRDVRDYKVGAGSEGRLGTSSPFNIKAESLTLDAFSRADVAALYQQHSGDTGQVFTPEAVDRAFELTAGQPWLVNALARQAVEVIAPDPAVPITAEIIDAAKEILIQRQDTHLDSLAERLREPRVRRVIQPILAGTALDDVPDDDIRFVVDLGLCRWNPEGGLVIANPIYREVIPRTLTYVTRASLPQIPAAWLTAEGRIDIGRLLDSFLDFWRRHGEALLRSTPYPEIAPHLVMMAYLDRVANSGGLLEREYATGRGRIDLFLRYGPDRFAFELKVWREGRKDPLAEGLAQLDSYLGRLGLATGWLVIFDQRAGLPPIEDRTSAAEAVTPGGRRVTVVRG